MADTTVSVPQIATPSVQANIDASQITRPSDGTVVDRERIVAADPINFTGQASVTNARGMMVDDQLKDIMLEVLTELRVITTVLTSGLNVIDDPELLRADPSNLQRLQQ